MMTLKTLVDHDATREQVEEWCQQRSRALPVGDQLMLCRVLGARLLYTLAGDNALTPHLAMSGIWEPWVSMAIARHLRPGMSCLDVGACYGYYSVLMADIVGESGRVEAWEPYHHALVTQNAELNGLPIVVEPQCLGTGEALVHLAHPSRSRYGLFNAGGVATADQGLSATVSKPSGKVTYDFIKVDVEGAEADVWEALRLAAYPREHAVTVCLEFTPRLHARPGRFLEQVQSDGFRLGTVGHDGQPRVCSVNEALTPDTGDFRMLWLESP